PSRSFRVPISPGCTHRQFNAQSPPQPPPRWFLSACVSAGANQTRGTNGIRASPKEPRTRRRPQSTASRLAVAHPRSRRGPNHAREHSLTARAQAAIPWSGFGYPREFLRPFRLIHLSLAARIVAAKRARLPQYNAKGVGVSVNSVTQVKTTDIVAKTMETS